MSDEVFAVSLHHEYYSDMEYEDFAELIGLNERLHQLENELEGTRQDLEKKNRENEQLKGDLLAKESEFKKKNNEVERILEKLKNSSNQDSDQVNRLRQELAQAKKKAKDAENELRHAQDRTTGNSDLEEENKRLKRENNETAKE